MTNDRDFKSDRYWREAQLKQEGAGSAYHCPVDGSTRFHFRQDDSRMHLISAHEGLHSVQLIATTWGFAKLQLAAIEQTYLAGAFEDSEQLRDFANKSSQVPSFAELRKVAAKIGDDRAVISIDIVKSAYALSRLLDGEVLSDDWLRSAQSGWYLLAQPAHWETVGIVDGLRQDRDLYHRASILAKASPNPSNCRVEHLLEAAAFVSERRYLKHLIATGHLSGGKAEECVRGLEEMGKIDIYSRAYRQWCDSRSKNDEAMDSTFEVIVDLALNPNICTSLTLPMQRRLEIDDAIPGNRFDKLCQVTSEMGPIPLGQIPLAIEWVRDVCRRCGWDDLYQTSLLAHRRRNVSRSSGAHHSDVTERLRTPEKPFWEYAFEPISYSFAHGRYIQFLEAFALRGTHPFALQFGICESAQDALRHNGRDLGLLMSGLLCFDDRYLSLSRDSINFSLHRMAIDAVRHVLYRDCTPPEPNLLREPAGPDLFPDDYIKQHVNRSAGFSVYR